MIVLRRVLLPIRGRITDAIWATCYRIKNRTATIGRAVTVRRTDLGEHVEMAHHVQVTDSCIGERSSIGRYSKLSNVEMGAYCCVSWDVTIGAGAHRMELPTSHPFWHDSRWGVISPDQASRVSYFDKTFVGNDVWIGCGVTIKAGVKIGDGAVIGAGAVVTKDVAPYSIVAGVPAKELRKRFSEKTIEKLLEMQWWNWPDEKLKENNDFFANPMEEE